MTAVERPRPPISREGHLGTTGNEEVVMSEELHVKSVLDLVTGHATGFASARPRSSGVRGLATGVAPDLHRLYPWAFGEGVAGFGVAEKETSGKLLPDVALKVYVEKKRPIASL